MATVGTKRTSNSGTNKGIAQGRSRTTTLRTSNRPNTVLLNTTGNEVFTSIKTRGYSSGATIRGWLYECYVSEMLNGESWYLPSDQLQSTNIVPTPSTEGEIVLPFASPYTPPAGINICLVLENTHSSLGFTVTTDNANETPPIRSLMDNDSLDDPWDLAGDTSQGHAPVIWSDYTISLASTASSPYGTTRSLTGSLTNSLTAGLTQ